MAPNRRGTDVAVIEIQTIERSKRLEWVAIYSDTDPDRAARWASDLLTRVNPKPYLRILDRQDGEVIGAWQERGYEPKGDEQ